jgi:hypothetical protein
MTQQESYNHVGDAILARYDEWDVVVESLPSCGEEVDVIIAKFVDMMRTLVIANIEWR